MVRSDSIFAKDNLPSFADTTAHQGEPEHDSDPCRAELLSKKIDADEKLREKKLYDVEGSKEDTKEAPACQLQPQKPEAEPVPAYFFDMDCLDIAQKRTPKKTASKMVETPAIEFEHWRTQKRRRSSLSAIRRPAYFYDMEDLNTAQKRTPTESSSAELSEIEQEKEQEQEIAETEVAQEQPPSEVDQVDAPVEEDSSSLSTPTDEAPKTRRWAIPSETRVGGVSSRLRRTHEKPKRRGRFRLF